MVPKYEMKSKTTIETLQNIATTEPDRISLIIRHSERHFHESARMEPFMGLTENGKDESIIFGSLLEQNPQPKMVSQLSA